MEPQGSSYTSCNIAICKYRSYITACTQVGIRGMGQLSTTNCTVMCVWHHLDTVSLSQIWREAGGGDGGEKGCVWLHCFQGLRCSTVHLKLRWTGQSLTALYFEGMSWVRVKQWKMENRNSDSSHVLTQHGEGSSQQGQQECHSFRWSSENTCTDCDLLRSETQSWIK